MPLARRALRSSLAALALGTGLLGLAACESEIDNKPAAAVADAGPAKPAAPAALEVPAGAAKLTANSRIEWIGAKVTKDHPGGFKVLDGYAQLDGEAIEAATVVIDLGSLFSDSEKLTRHLKDPDFFDVARFPTSTFTITEVAPGGAEGRSHTVTGTLDLHGVKKEISFPADVTFTPEAATIAAEFTLNRQDFGMKYPGKPDDLIRDEVLVKGQLAFAR